MPPTSTLTGTAQDRAAAIAQRCGGGRENARGWQVCCPAHDDHDPSLHITARDDKVLLRCWAGCENTAIVAAIGLTMRDLFVQEDDESHPQRTPRLRTFPTRRMPPEGVADPLVLAYTVDLVIDDVEMLTVDGVVQVLKLASASPRQWLWVERVFKEAGMSPTIVWQVLFPQAEEPYLYTVSRDAPVTYEQRLVARLRRHGHGRRHRR